MRKTADILITAACVLIGGGLLTIALSVFASVSSPGGNPDAGDVRPVEASIRMFRRIAVAGAAILIGSGCAWAARRMEVAERSAPPNGGPASSFGGSGVSGGPPSVS
jgi:hypothetical protein